MGVPSGQSLGTATGSIVINTQSVLAAQQTVANASRQMSASLSAIGVGAGAFGIQQLTRFVLENEKLTTAYTRQRVAAVGLAGSQGQLNDLLKVYGSATGGAVDQAASLANVTKLMSVGFADSAEELDKFARSIRGISVAMGTSQDTVTQNLILELFTQRGMRLDQLGLQYDKVRQRANQLQAADASLTQQMAYQQAVLEQAEQRFGKLADSAEGARTGMENAARAWKDFRLAVGQVSQGGTNLFGDALANWLDTAAQDLMTLGDALVFVGQAIGVVDRSISGFGNRLATPPSGSAPWGSRGAPPGAPAPADMTERNAITVDWWRESIEIDRQAASDRLDALGDHQRQRSDTIRQYEQTITREARDFATNRLRQEQDHAAALADVHEAAAERETRMAEDLARTIGRAQADSNERLADMQEALDRTVSQRRRDSAERVAEWEENLVEATEEKRKESAGRLAEIEGEFNRERERAHADHRDALLSAAARLDARAVWQEQRRFEREASDRLDAHDREIEEEKTKLQEGIDELNAAHQERLDDEKRALDKSISQANEAHARQVDDEKEALEQRIADANDAYTRQLEDARAADQQRIDDMNADFALRKQREDADRLTRLTDLTTDHNNQLTEQDRVHGLRMKQIDDHALEERTALDEKFKAALYELGVHVDGYAEELDRVTDTAIANSIRLLKGISEAQELVTERNQINQRLPTLIPGTSAWTEAMHRRNEIDTRLKEIAEGGTVTEYAAGGYVPRTGLAMLHAGEYVMPAAQVAATGTGTHGGGININNLTIHGVPTGSAQEFGRAVRRELVEVLREVNR